MTAPARPSGKACAACGAPLEPAQDYCLECGSRIAHRRGPFGAVAQVVEARFGRYPGDWIWVSLLMLGIAGGGATAAIALTDDATGGGNTIVATSTPPTISAPVTTAARPPTATAGLPTTAKPTSAPKPAVLKAWPAQSGYTVVLASIPARGAGGTEARSQARAALGAGLPQVGILVSDNFASLHPGYYVVFSGVYDSLEDAITAARRARGRFPAAYARQIAR